MCRMSPATAWNGTKAPSPVTRPRTDLPGVPAADRRETLPGAGQLTEDARLHVVAQGRVRTGDQLAEPRNERSVLGGQFLQPGPGGVDEADAVIGEVGDLDDPGPRAGVQAGRDMLAVLLVGIPAGRVVRIGERGH